MSLNSFNNKKIFNPKLSLKHNHQTLKINHNSKTKKIFSAKKIQLTQRTWKFNSKIYIPKKDFFIESEETKIKDERIGSNFIRSY